MPQNRNEVGRSRRLVGVAAVVGCFTQTAGQSRQRPARADEPAPQSDEFSETSPAVQPTRLAEAIFPARLCVELGPMNVALACRVANRPPLRSIPAEKAVRDMFLGWKLFVSELEVLK